MFHQGPISMKSRRDRILDVAISLAEEGGFDNVRQRDVAEQAGVALGTLYKAFRTKEDLLSAALARETRLLELRMQERPAKGNTPVERVSAFFHLATSGMCRKPHYARAVLRAVASGEPEAAKNVVSYQGRMNRMILAALRGGCALTEADLGREPPSQAEATLALLLQQLWFAGLVAWSAGMLKQKEVIDQMQSAAEILMRGLDGWEHRPAEATPEPARRRAPSRPGAKKKRAVRKAE
jgi:AcrR family transcriptional regulator